MSTRHDLQCDRCDKIYEDMPVSCDGTHCHCGGKLEIAWHACHSQNARALDPKETTVVYEHPETGKIIYPGKNDVVMPLRYRTLGYQRKELTSLSEVDKFSKAHGVVNERAHYDRGSGRGYDDK